MTDPGDALERARAGAASMRGAGAYAEDFSRLEVKAEELTLPRLMEWAVIEPDLGEVRSTRRWGAPLTALKRLLLQLLAQYHAELLSQQTRFNVSMLAQLRRLEDRVAELERGVERSERRP